jgi:uncharacterized protein
VNKPNHRRCISCRRIAPKNSFWRVVRVYPSCEIQIDTGMGRSAYICPDIDCVKAASLKKRLSRSLKANIPEYIYQNLQNRFAGEC